MTKKPSFGRQLLNALADPHGDIARQRAAQQALHDVIVMADQFDAPNDAGRVEAFVAEVRQVASRGLGVRRG